MRWPDASAHRRRRDRRAGPDGPGNAAWRLEDFVDSLVVELDKTRETLAVKAINKPLSYSVKEVALDVNAFPTYDGDAVRFTTAQPGQDGASKLTIQLGSITDQQVRATTKVRGRPARGEPRCRSTSTRGPGPSCARSE